MKALTRKIVICPCCKGNKQVPRFDTKNERYFILCTICMGDGMMTKTKQISYERIQYAKTNPYLQMFMGTPGATD